MNRGFRKNVQFLLTDTDFRYLVIHLDRRCSVQVNFALEQAMKAQGENRDIVLLFV